MPSNDSMSSFTILAVDDSHLNHKIVKKMLSQEFTVDSAFSGQECLQYLQGKKPELILLDVTMPDLDGYETCKLIKSNPQLSSIPILFLSGRCSIEEKLKGYEVGGDDYITKPFDELELAAKIKKAIAVCQKSRKLHQRAEVASVAVSQAIKVSSSIHTCMRFMGKLAQVDSLEALCSVFFIAARELGLATTLHIRSKPEPVTIFEDGIEKELEVELFRRTQIDRSFFQLGRHLLVQFEEITLLIKNIPLLEAREQETLKSYILTLVEGFHTRWRSLQAEEGVRRQREVLGVTLLKAKELVDKMASNFQLVMSNSHDIFEEALGSVEHQLAEFGLNEQQESSILSQMNGLLAKMESMHSHLLEKDHNIVALTDDLERVVEAMSKSIERDCGLANKRLKSQ